jgi:hypothetical protein
MSLTPQGAMTKALSGFRVLRGFARFSDAKVDIQITGNAIDAKL